MESPTHQAGLPGAAPAAQEPLRIYYVRGTEIGRPGADPALPWDTLCKRVRAAGFNALLTDPLWLRPAGAAWSAAPLDPDRADPGLATGAALPALLQRVAASGARHGLQVYMDLVLDRIAADCAANMRYPDWYLPPVDDPARDPRMALSEHGIRYLREGPLPQGFIHDWSERLARWLDAGLAGFRIDAPHRIDADDWRAMLAPLRAAFPDRRFLAWTPGLDPQQLKALRGAGFDAVFSSLPWWDFHSPWLAEEHARLRAIAPVIATPPGLASATRPQAQRALWTAGVSGDGILVEGGLDTRQQMYAQLNAWIRELPSAGALCVSGGRDGMCTVLVHHDTCADGASSGARVLLANPAADLPARVDWDHVGRLLPAGEPHHDNIPPAVRLRGAALEPEGVAVFIIRPLPPVQMAAIGRRGGSHIRRGSRIAVENVAPTVDNGRFATKCVAHDQVCVQADIYTDGHEKLAAQVLWRAADETGWRTVPMRALPNDRWEASISPYRVGRHEFMISAWRDTWETFRTDLMKKRDAGLDLTADLMDGAALLRAALALAREASAAEAVLAPLVAALETGKDQAASGDQAVEALLADGLADAMRELGDKPFHYSSAAPYPLWVDRRAARYASWYELFPRSMAAEPQMHGTFDDVIARLPQVRDMGFDVLYFPPIHPIGRTHRKGPNNSLHSQEGDVGSPYAIGGAEGGHDAIHPELGTLSDFLRLVQRTREHDMEIALDFAIQCSPDHPWLAQHPDWFERRADGTIRYAENPPKKYEDIVNVSFYGGSGRRARKSSLWLALRDVVLFWVHHGVRIFRVDNPHTKPLPFWEWLIGEVQGRHPDVIFLSEAFTRPKMMYRLAKVGFTQSYTYFTWRNTRHELTEYLQELSAPPAADFFRPHFFVNTPDINPYFLQTSGRPGFLIRAALAATTSGLWGVYSGFELCEFQPVPGKEEYLDSEKYQLRQRDWQAPGNITAQIARLNAIRRANPALQTHQGFTAVETGNDKVLGFWKATPSRGNVVLAAISLDPHQAQSVRLEAPLWLFGQPDDGLLCAEDLLEQQQESWHGKWRDITLHPDQPYRLWRLSAHV
ncbi:maltotransferase domain-containing protein [Bordetella sp. BOR01]|uniref:maltotransferase domain-containing protein n=1 Tax=Bordetella sp. BOR01 TaxID=2854779 RepID=UPI001C44094E|nr:maltotransferase domain-containing protein [Bordetella sp. BOR01]MBV7486125.1 DUF3416 domain-containing protein [Bordetella sp. BOR01]